MIYLYFDGGGKKLYLFIKASDMSELARADIKWEEIDSVTTEKKRGQICAHVLGKGIVAEFPLTKTVLTCQKPIKVL